MSRPIGSKNSKTVVKEEVKKVEVKPEVKVETPVIEVTDTTEAPELIERRKVRMAREEAAKKEREASGLRSFK